MTPEVTASSDARALEFAFGRLRAVAGESVPVFTEPDSGLAPGGFRLTAAADGITVQHSDGAGAMYGVLDVAEQIAMSAVPGISLDAPELIRAVRTRTSEPRVGFRALKFNLPWMSYRRHESLQVHDETCSDLGFWSRLLDMMAENRFNALSLWSMHPFHYMVRTSAYPEACPFSEEELAEWRAFWTRLFAMAHDRCIEVYLINWNIFVSPELARARGVATYSIGDDHIGPDGDTSELVKEYMRESVTRVIDEYPGLDGIGFTLGEQMGGMSPAEREAWIEDTFGRAISDASRPIKVVHRAPLSADRHSGGSVRSSVVDITRGGIERLALPEPPLVEIKFNWSHGHSSPRLCLIHGGKASSRYWDPAPEAYRIAWTVRNEDFFVLRWGEPDFIREHVVTNAAPYVGGYFIGSECYIPAKNYIDREDLPGRHEYAFERQWLFYLLWGRLLYDPTASNDVFEHAMARRHGPGTGRLLLEAYQAVSRTPLRIAGFRGFTWDFTLYAEGFLAGSDGKPRLITANDLAEAQPVDPRYLSVAEYVALEAESESEPNEMDIDRRITPLDLAQSLESDARLARENLGSVESLVAEPAARLAAEITDIRAWVALGEHFAAKLRAAVAIGRDRASAGPATDEIVRHLERAVAAWDELCSVTDPVYAPVPLIHLGDRRFSWGGFQSEVRAELEKARSAVQ